MTAMHTARISSLGFTKRSVTNNFKKRRALRSCLVKKENQASVYNTTFKRYEVTCSTR